MISDPWLWPSTVIVLKRTSFRRNETHEAASCTLVSRRMSRSARFGILLAPILRLS